MLRPADATVLGELGLAHEVQDEPGFVCILIKDFRLPAGLRPDTTTLLLRLPLGFPDATPDMFWLDPPATSPESGIIPGTELTEIHVGRRWQRWSRHIQGQWRPGVDNLRTYLAYVRRCLDQASGRP